MAAVNDPNFDVRFDGKLGTQSSMSAKVYYLLEAQACWDILKQMANSICKVGIYQTCTYMNKANSLKNCLNNNLLTLL